MKVALYARVSLEESNKDNRRYQEPDNQLVPLREWAHSQGWEVVGEYTDRASGGDRNRPQFMQMLNAGMLRKYKYVLVWKLDRFSREGISHTLAYIEKLKSRGVGVKSMTEHWLDTSEDNPLSEMLLSIFSWVASEERRKISERTKLGIQRRRNIGQWKGGRPKKRVAPEPIEPTQKQ